MRKIIYFAPFIAYVLFILWASGLFGFNSLEVSAWIFGIMLFVSSFMLSRKIYYGGIIGMIPAVYLIYAGENSKTGIEKSIGFVLLLFYLLSIYSVWREKKATDNRNL